MNLLTKLITNYSGKLWFLKAAKAHALGDYECGRKWECACGACRVARENGYKLHINIGVGYQLIKFGKHPVREVRRVRQAETK